MKKTLTLLTGSLLFTLTALAQFSGGNGTQASPYLISNTQQLDSVRYYPTSHFKQTKDLNLSSYNTNGGWLPIGNATTEFNGNYDGSGFFISNLIINRPNTSEVGLFGQIGQTAVIKNVKLFNVSIAGARATGSLVGRVKGSTATLIENCSVVQGSVTGDGATGGLVGSNNSVDEQPGGTNNPIISKCFANVSVHLSSPSASGKDKFGGLVGCNQKGTTLNSYARGSVLIGGGNGSTRVGGLAGCTDLRGRIEYSFATGAVSGASNVGGLVGNIGTGGNAGVIVSSFWDTQTSGTNSSAAGTGYNTANMKNSANYGAWDLVNTWQITNTKNDGYPSLRVDTTWVWTGNANSDWNTTSNWLDGVVPPSTATIVIANGVQNMPAISGSVGLKELIVSSGAELTISPNSALTIQERIINNGNIVVENSASLIQSNTGGNNNIGDGTYEVLKTGKNTANQYNVWSSPVTSAGLLSTFVQTNPCDMYVFEPTSQSWKRDFQVGFNTTCMGNNVTFQNHQVINNGDGVMDVARGYFIPGNSNFPTRSYIGEVNNGTLSLPIYLASNPGNVAWAGDDWNLIGNPYPSSLNSNLFWQENAGKITGALYFWDEIDTGNYSADDYASWNPIGVVAGPNSGRTPNGNIASGQGFWVIANTNTNIEFNNSMRNNNNNQFFKDNSNEFSRVWVRLENQHNQRNDVLIGFPTDATLGVDDMYDAPKMESGYGLYMATVNNGKNYVIQGSEPLNYLNRKQIFPLHIKSVLGGENTLKIEKADQFSKITLYVYDAEMDSLHNLKLGEYSFETAANADESSRFSLIFEYENFVDGGVDTKIGENPSIENPTTSIENLNSNNGFKVFSMREEVRIESLGNSKIAEVNLIDMSGRVVYNQNAGNSEYFSVNIGNISNGIYVVSVRDQNNKMHSHKLSIAK